MKIGLFIPCYVDALYPEVGVATYKLLRKLKLDVVYPERQTCCGQPMANGGFQRMSGKLAEKFDDIFKEFDYVVTPSVSCASFVRVNHPQLHTHECKTPETTMELVEFLHDVLKVKELPGSFDHVVSVHNSDECCGFGGMFAVEEPEVSTRMGVDKLQRHMATGAEFVTGPDSSCLMHMQGIANKNKYGIRFKHVAEILAAGI